MSSFMVSAAAMSSSSVVKTDMEKRTVASRRSVSRPMAFRVRLMEGRLEEQAEPALTKMPFSSRAWSRTSARTFCTLTLTM